MTGFRRAGLTVLIGTAAGAALALALTPVLSRLVTPSVFGSFMTWSAIASVLVGASTLRLEVVGQRTVDDREARAILGLATTLAIVTGALLTLVTLVLWLAGLVPTIALASGVMVALASLQLVGTSGLARERSYKRLSQALFVQNGLMTAAQAAFAFLSGSVGALLLGFLVARLVWLWHVPKLLLERHEISRIWIAHRNFALTAGTSAGINSLAGQIPILVPALLYGDQAAGWFAMAVRVLVSPLSLVGQAAAAAALGEISMALRGGDGDPRRVFRRGLRDLLVLGAVPALLAGVFGSVTVQWLLGDAWGQTGLIVAALSLGAWAQFSAAPFSQVLNLAERSRWLLRWDITRLVLLSMAFLVPGAVGLGIVTTAWCYSVALVALYVPLAITCDCALAAEAGDGRVT